MISQSRSPSLGQDWLLSGIDKIRSNWFKLKKEGIKYTDMYIAKKLYIEPIRDLCEQNMQDPRSATISKKIMRCVYIYNDIEETKKVFRRRYLLLERNYIIVGWK